MKTNRKTPKTPRSNTVETLHGTRVPDPYRWLENAADPRLPDWIKRQQFYSRSHLDTIRGREALRKRFTELFRLDTVGVPYPVKGRYFFAERKGSEDLAVLYMREGLNGPMRVLIDPNTLSVDKTTVLSSWYPSPDGKLVAYGISTAANDKVQFKVLDVDAGQDLPDSIPGDSYPYFSDWSRDTKGFWYGRAAVGVPAGEEKLHQKLYYHALGTPVERDQLVFGAGLPKENIPSISVSNDGRWLLFTAWRFSLIGDDWSTDLYLQDLDNADAGIVPIIKDKDAQFFAWIVGNTIYARTNHNAPQWKIMSIPIAKAAKGIRAWKTVIPEGPYPIDETAFVGNSIFVSTLENIHSVLRQYTLAGTPVREVPLPTLGSTCSFTGEYDGDELFFEFSSFVTPRTIYRLDIPAGAVAAYRKAASGIDENAFVVEQVWYPSKDGTKIPMFLVHRKGFVPRGNTPAVLYGYGGFNISITPEFDKRIVPFLERGGIYAIASIRGGAEFGETWHRAGMRKNKQNVFDDFISAAEWLIAERYTNRRRLAISGWSNGGLLVGALLTQRPDLFRAGIMGTPVADMLRFHLSEGGRYWIPDYGSPDDPEMFKTLLRYSPYHNVRRGVKYPAVLIVTADKDDRVNPFHAFKMAAALQEANRSRNPILLRVETQAGHAGAASIPRFIKQETDIWSFLFWQLGLEKKR